jgi:APA family basic amino acid/polyamine antiporter
MFGALNSNLLAGPRIYFAMARDGLFPRFVRQIHGRYQTPSNAVLVQSAWSIIQIVLVFWIVKNPKDAFDTLTDFVILGGTFFYALVVGAVFVLRAKMPTAHRPYPVWGYPFTPALYLLVAALVIGSIALNPFLTSTAGMTKEQLQLAYADQLKVPAVALLMLVGVGLYFVFRRLEARST